MKELPEQELFSVPEVCALARVSPSFLARLCRSGTVPSVKFGRVRRLHRNVVVDLLHKGIAPSREGSRNG
jgi:excisionase family DNA binding protein